MMNLVKYAKLVLSLRTSQKGAALIEYIILVSAILVLATALTAFTNSVDAEYDEMASEVSAL